MSHCCKNLKPLSWPQFLFLFMVNQIWQIIEKGPLRDYLGRPLMTATNDSNPWWSVFKQAITAVGEKLSKPEILGSTTDARYLRQKGIPVLGFSPMKNTPILLHDHNEVQIIHSMLHHYTILISYHMNHYSCLVFFNWWLSLAALTRYRVHEGNTGIRVSDKFLVYIHRSFTLNAPSWLGGPELHVSIRKPFLTFVGEIWGIWQHPL